MHRQRGKKSPLNRKLLHWISMPLMHDSGCHSLDEITKFLRWFSWKQLFPSEPVGDIWVENGRLEKWWMHNYYWKYEVIKNHVTIVSIKRFSSHCFFSRNYFRVKCHQSLPVADGFKSFFWAYVSSLWQLL